MLLKMKNTQAVLDGDELSFDRFRWWKEVFRRFKKNKLAMTGLVWFVVVIFCAVFADVIAPYGFNEQDISKAFTPMCLQFPLGTDNFGRDIFSRIIYGSQVSIEIGIVSVSFSLIVGGFLGAIAAYYKKLDNIIMRFMDLFMAIPSMLLAIVIAATLGTGMINLMIAVGIAAIPRYARVVRSAFMSVKNYEYIEAARCIGGSDKRIILKHILPNALSPILIQATLSFADAIITAAAMSFIGLGVQAPNPEWGAMLSNSRAFVRLHPYMSVGPGIAIMLLSYSLNVIGDGLRDALDPRLKS